jgi:4-hydroxybenzoate polyprenyltransferase
MSVTAFAQSGQLRSVIVLLRPKQWIKNGFVLAPLVFSGGFTDGKAVGEALLATLLFCIASSATYIVNDLHDVESDRKHPVKSKSRPLAAGTITKGVAYAALILLYACLIAGSLAMPGVVGVIAAYVVLNLLYTFVLKHQPVVDIFTVAIGFTLRVYAGAIAISVPVSQWMFVTTLCLALYLAAVKRRQELALTGSDGRKALKHYSLSLIDRYAEMSATGALVFFGMFVMSERPELVITIPLVLFGLFRYWYVVEAFDSGESPTDALLADWQLLLTVALWVAICGWVIFNSPA